MFTLCSQRRYILIYSCVIGGCRWRVVAAYSKGIKFNDALSLYLAVADAESLPCGWSRHAEFSFTVVNQMSEEHSQLQDVFRDFTETEGWFDHKTPVCGCASSFPLGKLDAKYGGFILNYQVKVVAEVKVLEAIGKSIEDTTTNPPPVEEVSFTSVYGFPVIPSEVELVSRMFENHPDVALEWRNVYNPYSKRGHMYSLIGLIETLQKPLQEISMSNLANARDTMVFLRYAGLQLDWVEKKMKELTAKKMEKEELGQVDI
ncbi:PREDICTED: MATH domain and coiled-coil domain-containing protein At3g58210-like [Camelina sativa]|uniref:MATH domain and coiled-coil domain-containing protein At3g58210-like n=1 Tax=Camelina sativa TaxID=90675 RepID=A0ABM0URI1_CAMSA|nr:PREDICTED: MATH domain and coiled-coil domain-containing protein At3g58210-like [Camelina sativa]